MYVKVKDFYESYFKAINKDYFIKRRNAERIEDGPLGVFKIGGA